MNNAMGMVSAMENTPHGEAARAFTTISARTARMMIMMANTAISAAIPPTSPISSRTICPRLFPPRRMEKKSTVRSCTAPANSTPTTIQIVPGRYPICAARTGPTSGPAPAIAAKWCPKRTRRSVTSKSTPFSYFSAGVARRSSAPSTR